jgi:hypothetical protein
MGSLIEVASAEWNEGTVPGIIHWVNCEKGKSITQLGIFKTRGGF